MKYFFLALAALTVSSHAQTVIDFEGLALAEGSAVTAIGIATFTADAAVQGGVTGYAFGSTAGADTGTGGPFDVPGNTFICGPGGIAGQGTVKTITIDFSEAVSNLSFLVCDIDSFDLGGSLMVNERLKAEAFDAASRSIGVVTQVAPGGGGGRWGRHDGKLRRCRRNLAC